MPKPNRTFRALAVSLALSVALPLASTASAQSTRDAVIEIARQSLVANGAKEVTFGKVDGDDARFTVSDTRIVSEAEGKTTTLTAVGSTWTGAAPTPDGGYKADEIAFDNLAVDAEDSKLSATRLVITNYRGPAPARVVPGKISGERLEKLDASGIVVTGEDGKKIPISAFSFAASDYVGDTPRKASFDLKGMEVPLDPKDTDTAQVRALGYEKISLDASFAGTWDDKTGRLDITAISIGAADVGALQMTATVGGLTPTVVEAMKKAEGDQGKQMELLQALTVEKLSLRWTDASLTGRVLAMQAKEQGTDAKTYAKQLKLLLPTILSMMGNKDFEKKVATAAGAFLDAPKSLTVSARPTAPVSFGQVLGTAMTAPQALPNVLGADVVAND